ncbi:MAG: DUF4349 domain-containing protein [Sphingobium sp.]
MDARPVAVLILMTALSSCGQRPEGGVAQEALDTPAAPSAPGKTADAGAVPVSIPQIAYAYDYNFRLPGDRVVKVQEAHMALCDRLGPARCHILDMQRAAGEYGYQAAELKLEVEASHARAFGAQLEQAVTSAGGAQSDSSIKAEDLSKKIVDTEARLRSKELLAARLTELLQSRKGTVAELVEAERSVAAVQEEIDQARSWLTEMRGRVAMSRIDIHYSSEGGGRFMEPLRRSFSDLGEMAGASLATLIQIIVLALPWLAFGALLLFIRRRFGGTIGRFLRRPREDRED